MARRNQDTELVPSELSWKKEGRLQTTLKNKSMIWVKTDNQWKEANVKRYNPHDRSWDVNWTGDEDGTIVSCRDYEIKLNEGDEE